MHRSEGTREIGKCRCRCGVASAVAALLLVAGCAQHERVQNPFPGVFRVVVVPFNDKSNGAQGVDPDAIATLFASELQKIPTFEVVPVHEVKQVLRGQRIETNQPELAFAVARAVHAQAVIVGDVTEYNAYYPPRIGLHCELYAMVTGQAEMVVQNPPLDRPSPDGRDGRDGRRRGLGARSRAEKEPKERDNGKHGDRGKCGGCGGKGCKKCAAKTAPAEMPDKSSADENDKAPGGLTIQQTAFKQKSKEDTLPSSEDGYSPSQLPKGGIVARPARANGMPEIYQPVLAATPDDVLAGRLAEYQLSNVRQMAPEPVVEPWVVRHSRVFDGNNLGTFRKLNDYYFFRKDDRAAEAPGFLERSEDFNRFACNRMIFEMLEAAGGRWTRLWGVRYPKPWNPWPWR